MLSFILAATVNIDLENLLGAVDWSRPSWDIFIILFFLVGGLLYGLSLGRDRLVVIMMSIYISLAVVDYAPFINQTLSTSFKLSGQVVNVKLVAFVGLLLFVFFILSRSALAKTLQLSNDSPFWQTLIFSILHIGLILSVVLSLLPPAAREQLSVFTRQVFIGQWQQFGWIVAPLLAMILFGRGSKTD